MNAKLWILVILTTCLASSCFRSANPHRAPAIPFQTIDTYSDRGGEVDYAAFDYVGDLIKLDGVLEIDRKTDTIKVHGLYETRQELEDEASLAMQIYTTKGELLVRDLPRIPFEDLGDRKVAYFDESYGISDWGLGFGIDNVLVQFNYIVEGEFWYDMRFPDMELPSFAANRVSPMERFKPVFEPIPRIVPQSTTVYLPAVFKIRKTHGEAFLHQRAAESFAGRGDERIEQPRRAIESSVRWIGDRALFVNSLRLEEAGLYRIRNGFVWDGIRWDRSFAPEGFKYVVAVPLGPYLLGCGFAILVWLRLWRAASGCRQRFGRFVLQALMFALAASGIFALSTSPLALVVGIFPAGLWLAHRSWNIQYRCIAISLLMLALLEFYWGSVAAQRGILFSGLLASVLLYAIVLFPLALVKRRSILIVAFVILGIGSVFNYLLLDIYFSFFNDYPTLRMLSYASQTIDLVDSVRILLDHRHIVSLTIAVWFSFCYCLALLGKPCPESDVRIEKAV